MNVGDRVMWGRVWAPVERPRGVVRLVSQSHPVPGVQEGPIALVEWDEGGVAWTPVAMLEVCE